MPKMRPQNPRFFFGSAAGGVGVGALGCATVWGAATGAAAAGAGVGASHTRRVGAGHRGHGAAQDARRTDEHRVGLAADARRAQARDKSLTVAEAN